MNIVTEIPGFIWATIAMYYILTGSSMLYALWRIKRVS